MVTTRSAAAALLLLASVGLASTTPVRAVLQATPASTLSGDVRDELGRALEGAEVLVLSGTRGVAAASTLSNSSGRFLVDHVAPGVYRVAAIKSGYVAAIGVVNTYLRSSVELVLHPVPKGTDAGAQNVQDDLSWTLRVPPRSILEQLDPTALLASTDPADSPSSSMRLPDSIRGSVEHVVALGAFRPASGGPSAALLGNETRMQFAGSLGDRGAIQVAGRHGSLDSPSGSAPSAAVSRAASDVDVDVSYDTGDDARLAMRAFYSTGDLEVGERPGVMNQGARQGQRSWGYEGQWHKQVDGTSRVALQVGIHDASLDLARGAAEAWDASLRDASNRSIGAEGQYESLAGAHHLLRFGVRAQLMDLSAPLARIGRASGTFPIEGTTGWSVLMDAEDQWSISGPVALTYGLAYRQGFDGPFTAAATPRLGASWTTGRFRGHAAVTVLATTELAAGPDYAASTERHRPVGYDLEVEAPVTRTVILRGTASSVPLRSNVWRETGDAKDLQDLYVTDGSVSDQFVALALERSAGNATVTFRVAQGRADGALAPAIDRDVPVVLLAERSLAYRSMRLGTLVSRTGSSVSIEYRSIDEQRDGTAVAEESLQTVEAEFTQQLARLAGGRASCRLLISARTAVGSPPQSPEADPSEARRFAALYQRLGAGVSLAF
jgi:hypothetical protein